MTRKILLLFVFLIGVSLSASLAQSDSDYKGLKFDAQPKHQSEIGISVGHFMVVGDVLPRPSWGVGLHFRRAFDYAFSWRIDAMYGQALGLEPRNSGSSHVPANEVLNGSTAGIDYSGQAWYANYQTKYMSLSLEGIWSLNSFNFKKQIKKMNWYLVGGIGINSYKAYYDALDGNTQHDFSSVDSGLDLEGSRTDRGEAKDRVKDILDGDYETRAEVATGRRSDDEDQINFHANVGVGVSFKLNEKFNISLEHQATVVFGNEGDLLDGYRWRTTDDLSQYRDLVNYTSVRFNVNIGKKEDRSEPLWWVSPLSLIAEDLAEVQARPVFDTGDDDNDGVVNAVDQEPDTPEGFAVDTKGVQLDSDGDGVADGNDKEPYSPPGYTVDGEGIAQVPMPDILDEDDVNRIVDSKLANYAATAGADSDWWLPMIHFNLDRYNIKPSEFGKLHQVASIMKKYPDKRVAVIGHTDRTASNCYNDVLSYNRADAAINYLVNKYGISRDRFIINWSGEGEALVDTNNQTVWNRRVEFRVATDEANEERPDCRSNAGKGGTGYSGNKEAGY